MDDDAAESYACLDRLRSLIPYRYAQWIVEEPGNHDYRVVASIIPEGEQGYDIAHRTGVIGQVFRTSKTIIVPDALNHHLYDPFDHTIGWELCFPVFKGAALMAVVNFEGTGVADVGDWARVRKIVEEMTTFLPPTTAPAAEDSCLVETRLIEVGAGREGVRESDVIELARAVARGGESTLLVGHYPELLRGRGPTTDEASKQGLGVSYCYFGVEPRLDLLAATSVTREFILDNHMGWWDNCRGRYAFVVLAAKTQ